ncbi:MAG: dihydrofolate reductase family protein [Thermomicrobiales bacterium]
MGKVILGMTMSLDGFVNDRNGAVHSLYPDLAALRETDLLQEAIQTTGAVVMGRRTYTMGDPDAYADTYEFQVPIFVLTHAAPEKQPKENKELTFTFVTDGIERTLARARIAAGARNVMVVGGANVFQQCIRASLCDEIHIGIMPVLLGEGLRLFAQGSVEQRDLETLRVIESAARIDTQFRVLK